VFDTIPAPPIRVITRARAAWTSRRSTAPGPGVRLARLRGRRDGNETGGIALPEVAVRSAPLRPGRCVIPRSAATAASVFAGRRFRSAHAQRARGLGRSAPSIAERYRSRDDYLERVRRAAVTLASERYILDEEST